MRAARGKQTAWSTSQYLDAGHLTPVFLPLYLFPSPSPCLCPTHLPPPLAFALLTYPLPLPLPYPLTPSLAIALPTYPLPYSSLLSLLCHTAPFLDPFLPLLLPPFYSFILPLPLPSPSSPFSSAHLSPSPTPSSLPAYLVPTRSLPSRPLYPAITLSPLRREYWTLVRNSNKWIKVVFYVHILVSSRG